MSDFERCLNVLRDAGVQFVVIGGMASSAHGSASVTYDLDICYDRSPANMQRLAAALAPYHPRLRGVPADVPFRFDVSTLTHGQNFTLTTDLGDLDLFGEVAGVGSYPNAKAASITLEVFGGPCLVLSLEALIRSKRASGRKKDLLVLPELEALREIVPRADDRANDVTTRDRKKKRRNKMTDRKQ